MEVNLPIDMETLINALHAHIRKGGAGKYTTMDKRQTCLSEPARRSFCQLCFTLCLSLSQQAVNVVVHKARRRRFLGIHGGDDGAVVTTSFFALFQSCTREEIANANRALRVKVFASGLCFSSGGVCGPYEELLDAAAVITLVGPQGR